MWIPVVARTISHSVGPIETNGGKDTIEAHGTTKVIKVRNVATGETTTLETLSKTIAVALDLVNVIIFHPPPPYATHVSLTPNELFFF